MSPQAAGHAAAEGRPVRLGAVLDDVQPVVFRDVHDGADFGGMPVQVDRHDRLRLLRDGLLEQRGVHRVAFLVDVHQDRPGAAHLDGGDGRDGCVRHRDHFVVRADSAGKQGQVKRFGAAADADPVVQAQVAGELLLEGGRLGAEDVPAALQHPIDGSFDLILVGPIVGQRAVHQLECSHDYYPSALAAPVT